MSETRSPKRGKSTRGPLGCSPAVRLKILNRLMANMAISPSGCWLWKSSPTLEDYGTVSVLGRKYRVHRLSYLLMVSPIPDGLGVLHRCDTPACFNPEHLFLGTNLDNARDMASKGRAARPIGELHPRAKLKWDDVDAIRASTEPGKVLAERYGVRRDRIYEIKNHRAWKLPGPAA